MGENTMLRLLAALGGLPAFPAPLGVGTPNLGNRRRFLRRARGVLRRRVLTNNGPLVREFERRVADLVGVRHCVATHSATAGLQVAARALGLSGEVVIPAFTFIATAHALHWQGITPVFADIDRETHNLDPAAIERALSPRTTGILGVHLWGRPCDVEALAALARRRGLKLLFDAAHALGCSHRGRMVGTFADAEVFSFHATKVVNSVEGGAVVTNHDDLAEEMRLMRNFGFAGNDRVVCAGINGKMDELSAAMGLTSLESFDEFLAVNRRNYELYARGLAGIPGVRLAPYDDRERANRHYVVLEVDEQAAGCGRDLLMGALWKDNIMARRYFFPGCHLLEPYRSSAQGRVRLPETEWLAGRVLQLPTGTAVRPADVAVICDSVRAAVVSAPLLRRRLGPGDIDFGRMGAIPGGQRNAS